ncbi:Uncharacterised protein [uncultured archaeon]|nr:Uncharacterised protein [uncultured archaeon]
MTDKIRSSRMAGSTYARGPGRARADAGRGERRSMVSPRPAGIASRLHLRQDRGPGLVVLVLATRLASRIYLNCLNLAAAHVGQNSDMSWMAGWWTVNALGSAVGCTAAICSERYLNILINRVEKSRK